MELALRGLEPKTRDPHLAGWRKRITPSLGHLPVRMIAGLIIHSPARIHGWQQQIKQREDELDNPRALALPDWNALRIYCRSV